MLLVPAICKEILLYVPGSSLEASSKLDYLARAVGVMHSLCKKLELEEDSGESLEGVVSSIILYFSTAIIYTLGVKFNFRTIFRDMKNYHKN